VLFEDIGLTVNNIRIIKNRDGKLFAAFPSEKYTDRQDGTERYKNIVAMPEKETYFNFQHEMIHEYNNYDSVPLPKDEIVEGTAPQTKLEDNLPF